MSNGASYSSGGSMSNGNSPERTRLTQGWDIRPVSSWSLTIGKDPA